MIYSAVAETDMGTKRNIDQDSLLIRHIKRDSDEILLSVICDGMGGLSSGELASATVINKFSEWFDKDIIDRNEFNIRVVCDKWVLLLKEVNSDLINYGLKTGIKLGTTFTGILFIGNQFLLAHVGDTRLYYIEKSIKQISIDHTYIAKALAQGQITKEEAKTDRRRNALTQCIGASKHIEPQVVIGKSLNGGYLLCSDGFRHKISSKSILENLNPAKLTSIDKISNALQTIIENNKLQGETDNISAIYILRDDVEIPLKKKPPKFWLTKKLIIPICLFLLSLALMIIGVKIMCF